MQEPTTPTTSQAQQAQVKGQRQSAPGTTRQGAYRGLVWVVWVQSEASGVVAVWSLIEGDEGVYVYFDRGINSEEKSPDFLLQRLSVFSLAFPDHKRGPTGRFQGGQALLVPLHIAVSLGFPEGSIRLWPNPSISAIMHVPEAAMNEDDLAAPAEDQVRCTRQPLVVEPVPVAHREHQ